jgi:MFS superfamily sulfate permease-like transporter
MEKSKIKQRLLHFVVILIVSIFLGIIYHELIKGVILGILVGLGFVIGELLTGRIIKRNND